MSIELKNVTYTYSPGTSYEIHALKDINLNIPDGQFIGVIGHTGSGKSTLIQHLNALIQPTSGTVSYNGEDVWAENYNRRALRSEVGLVFQYPEHQLFEETVYKDIAFGPRNMELDEAEIDRRVHAAAACVGLSEAYLEKSPFDLSGGEKRRAAIAGVMAMEPDILILDEPTAGLDPRGREQVLTMIRDYRLQRDTTVLLVSHSMEDVARVADRVLVMDHGRVAMLDTVERVFSRAAELEAMGLTVPAVTQIMLLLKRQGVDVSTDVYTVEQAAARLLPLLGGEPSC